MFKSHTRVGTESGCPRGNPYSLYGARRRGGSLKGLCWLDLELWKWQFALGGYKIVSVSEGFPTSIEITDRERIWNAGLIIIRNKYYRLN